MSFPYSMIGLVIALGFTDINNAFAQPAGAVVDLRVPEVTDGAPAPGRRVRQFNPGYEGSAVYHLLYLPRDWEPGGNYPVVVEYAGNRYKTSPGTVEGSRLGYGITAGVSAIWICMPYVNQQAMRNEPNWWGDRDATIAYCKHAVAQICRDFGGDRNNVFIAGFSRGAIACNFIGLADDDIASLWKGFICHSHYDGVKRWPYEGSDRESAAERLKRLRGRPQFISHEQNVDPTRDYLAAAYPHGDFLFQPLADWDHTDSWVLYDVPERKTLRDWFHATITSDPDRRRDEPADGARQSGRFHGP